MTVPNRSYENSPDIEQEKRLQARQASEFARGERDELPPFVFDGPDKVEYVQPEPTEPTEPTETTETTETTEPETEPDPVEEPQEVTPEDPDVVA